MHEVVARQQVRASEPSLRPAAVGLRWVPRHARRAHVGLELETGQLQRQPRLRWGRREVQPRSRRVAACSLAGLQARASSPLTRIPPCLRLRHDMRGATGAQPSPAAPSRLAPPVSSTSGPSRYSVELPCPPRPSLQPTTTMCSSKGAEEPGPLPPPAAKPSPKRNEPKITATDASARWSTSRTNQPSKKGRRRVRLRAQKERRGRDTRAAVTAVTAAQPAPWPALLTRHCTAAAVARTAGLQRPTIDG